MTNYQSPLGEILLGCLEREARVAGSKAQEVARKRLQDSQSLGPCGRCRVDRNRLRLFCGACGKPLYTPETLAGLTEERALEKKLEQVERRRRYH